MAQPYFYQLRAAIKNDKQSFVDEMKHKGYKLTGREGLNKLTEIVLGLHKNLLKDKK